MMRRVAITGIGAVSGMGLGARPLWEGLCRGHSALRRIRRFDPSGFRSRVAAEIDDFSAKDHVPKSYRKAVKVMARDIEIAVAAAKFAVEDASLITRGAESGESTPNTYPNERMGCHIGSGLIAAETHELSAAMATARGESPDTLSMRAWGGENGAGMEALTPLWLLKYLPNMSSCHVTIIHGAEGPSNTITCGESSGLLSIGESTRVIQRDDADLCFSGGAESKVNLMGLLRTDLAGRLAASDGLDAEGFKDCWKLIRPYAPDATGSAVGEGGGIVILEDLASARARNARIYAEVVGFGAGQSDAFYTDPEASVEGYAAALEAAMNEAGLSPEDLDAVVPLASGIPDTDRAEALALAGLFGTRRVPVVALPPHVGNCFAGAGALQAVVGTLCLAEQRLPARLNGSDLPIPLEAGPSESRPASLRHVLVCSASLGGQNAALILKRAE